MSADLPPEITPPLQSTRPGTAPVPPIRPGRPARPRRRRGVGSWVLLSLGILVLIGSVVANVILLVAIGAGGDMTFAPGVLQAGKRSQTIAVYNVTGGIFDEAVTRFTRFYEKIEDNDNVKAVVLRVNSGGGGLTESDRMHKMVLDLRERGKTVVVSMGGVAASGAYYISAPADEIIAERTTVTGSIGVLAAWLVLEKTLGKIGVEPVVLKSTHARGWKDEMSPFRRPHDREIAHIRGLLDAFQDQFEQVVREGRKGKLKTRKRTYHIPTSQGARTVPTRHTEIEPFNGKIYLAEEAMALGLVDGIGYEEYAIERAADLAGLDSPRVVRYTPRKPMLTRLLEGEAHRPLLSLDADGLQELQTPRILLIWRAP